MWRFGLLMAIGCGALGESAPPMTMMDRSVVGPSSAGEATRGTVDGRADGKVEQERVQIVTGSVSVTVDAYDPARDALVAWVTSHGGHLADESSYRNDGQASSGSVVVRVPADQVDALVSWIQENDRVDQLQTHRQDVTEQWVDLEARTRAMRATEERLLALTADRTASLADVLAAETELSRVQGELESLVARQRVLGDQVALATLTVNLQVRTPFSPLVEETLGHELGRTFLGSVGAMKAVGRGLLVLGVALAPWILAATAAGGAFVAGVKLLLGGRR